MQSGECSVDGGRFNFKCKIFFTFLVSVPCVLMIVATVQPTNKTLCVYCVFVRGVSVPGTGGGVRLHCAARE